MGWEHCTLSRCFHVLTSFSRKKPLQRVCCSTCSRGVLNAHTRHCGAGADRWGHRGGRGRCSALLLSRGQASYRGESQLLMTKQAAGPRMPLCRRSPALCRPARPSRKEESRTSTRGAAVPGAAGGAPPCPGGLLLALLPAREAPSVEARPRPPSPGRPRRSEQRQACGGVWGCLLPAGPLPAPRLPNLTWTSGNAPCRPQRAAAGRAWRRSPCATRAASWNGGRRIAPC